MGPELWFNAESGRVHIRLAHTANNVAGLEDYRGETDPRRVPLAITPGGLTALTIQGSRGAPGAL